MNDKDKKAFDEWFKDAWDLDFDAYDFRHTIQAKAWQSACEYKQKEIDKLKNDLLRDKQWIDHFGEKIRNDKVIIENYEEMLNEISKIMEGFKL